MDLDYEIIYGGNFVNPPAFSILTRTTPGREKWLDDNLKSVKAQTFKNYTHFIINDKERKGVEFADTELVEIKDRITGKYIYILDDDEILPGNTVLEKLNIFISSHGNPDAVIVRSNISNQIRPKTECWVGKCAIKGRIATSNIVSSLAVYRDNIGEFIKTPKGSKWSCGDYLYIKKILESGYRVEWYDLFCSLGISHLGAVCTDTTL